MKKAHIEAVALNENTPQGEVSKALNSKKVHIILSSPEYFLHRPYLKEFNSKEKNRARIFGVLVDEAHVIHEWADNFRTDYKELKSLRIILGNNIPRWALSATFTKEIFRTVYKTLTFRTSRPFWGINAGVEPQNLTQYVYPMNSAASTYCSLIQFIPEGAQAMSDVPKTIIFFRTIQETRDACSAIKVLLPNNLHQCIQPFAASDDEETKAEHLDGLRDGSHWEQSPVS
jgi:superfamily II DNA helicase RecQ